tara:strand:+ start:1236 stop:1490 length:255 start_codon:yes stop_codon:yes gene_type:complete
MLVDKNENIIIPSWLIELFDNYDRQSLNYRSSVENHRQSLLEDAESLIELVEHNFTGFSIDYDITPEVLVDNFLTGTLYLDEVG